MEVHYCHYDNYFCGSSRTKVTSLRKKLPKEKNGGKNHNDQPGMITPRVQ